MISFYEYHVAGVPDKRDRACGWGMMRTDQQEEI